MKSFTPEYVILNKTTLLGKIPIYKRASIKSISSAFKTGTITNIKIPLNGNITFRGIEKTKEHISFVEFIEFTYKASSYIGVDDFEFEIEFNNNTIMTQRVKIVLKENLYPTSTKILYKEIYFNRNEVSYSETLNLTEPCEDRLSVAISNKDFLTNKYGAVISKSNASETIQFLQSDNNLAISATLDEEELVTSLTLNFEREDFSDLKTEYIKINKLEDNPNYFYNYIFHKADLNEDFYTSVNIITNDDSNASFEFIELEYPEAPIQSSNSTPLQIIEGDNFLNLSAFKENINGVNSIKLGRVVPSDSVNLAYFYNKISKLKSTVSTIETNVSTHNAVLVDKWIHKYDLSDIDDSIFEEYIEFTGSEGSEVGYVGVLYREYVLWKSEELYGNDSEYVLKTVKINGDSSLNVETKMYYENDNKSGFLNLSHKITSPVNSNYLSKEYNNRKFDHTALYEGIIRNKSIKYNASAKYKGVISKKDNAINLDPDIKKETIMIPDDNGILKDSHGVSSLQDTLFYITDKFYDNVALYYKHKLKFKVYRLLESSTDDLIDNSVVLVDENLSQLSDKFKYKVFLEPTNTRNIYTAYIYTSFVPPVDTPVYAIYNAIEESSGGISLNTIDDFVEKISVLPAFNTEDFTITSQKSTTKQSYITIHNPTIINDERCKVKFKYRIVSDGFSTSPISVELLNKDYALYYELDNFMNEDMIISDKENGFFMSAREMLYKYSSDEIAQREAISSNSIFKIELEMDDEETLLNRHKVIVYTDPDGSGMVFAKTYLKTGLEDGEDFSKKIDTSSIYYSKDNVLRKCFSVMCRNVNRIVVAPPVETDPMKGWFPRIKYSQFTKKYERSDSSVTLVYGIPEYNRQLFGKYGEPYIDVEKEKARHLSHNSIVLTNSPLYVDQSKSGVINNLKAYKKLSDGTMKDLTIKSFSFENSVLEFEDKLSLNDTVLVDYTYEEKYYNYDGFYKNFKPNSKMINLNLNPLMYYTSTNTNTNLEEASYNLFNKTINFFIKPMMVIDDSTGDVKETSKYTLYHKFDSSEALNPFDLHIGKIFVRHHASLSSTGIIDTRNRGGGVLESISDSLRAELEPESDYYFDISTADGKPYQSNSVIVAKFDNRILKAYGGNFNDYEVREALEKWSSYGAYFIVEFVDVVKEEELPNYTMSINRHIEEQLDFTPHFEVVIEE